VPAYWAAGGTVAATGVADGQSDSAVITAEKFGRHYLDVLGNRLQRRNGVLAVADIIVRTEDIRLLADGVKTRVDEQPKSRRGRKHAVSDEFIQQIVDGLMDHHDDFIEEDREWNCPAKLEAAVTEKLASKGLPVSESTVRRRVKPALANWRARKAQN
jgi:hypothetical protein